MSLSGVIEILDDSEYARYPWTLAFAAYQDGWNQASGGPPRWFPRYLTEDEAECWRDGWKEARAERAEYGDSVIIQRPSRVVVKFSHAECRRCPLLNARAAA
jgi:hypothetical protein